MQSQSSQFQCPHSGQVFRLLVQSLGLHLPPVGGRAAEMLGSGKHGRHARRFYAGGRVSEQARRDLVHYAVEAAHHAGLFAGFDPPRRGSDPQPEPKAYLARVVCDWLSAWDSVYFAAATGHHGLRPEAAGFAIGRQAALDIGVRAAALLHLCGVEGRDFLVLALGPTPLRSLLRYLQDPSVAQLPRLELTPLPVGADAPGEGAFEVSWAEPTPAADVLSPERLADELELDETTLAKWRQGAHLPSPESVECLVQHFAEPPAGQAPLRRWLRVQLALIDVEQRLAATIGAAFTRQLVAAFLELACFPRDFYWQGLSRDEFLLGQVEALEHGVSSELGKWALEMFELSLPLTQIFPPTLAPEVWSDDVQAARAGRVAGRLAAALADAGKTS